MNQRPNERSTGETMTPPTPQNETRRGPEPPPTQAELNAMNRPPQTTNTPGTDGGSATSRPREEGGLSTADVASAMDKRGSDGAGGPKLVEGEETSTGSRAQADARSTPLFPENDVQQLHSR